MRLLRLWLLTQDITPGACSSVPEHKARRGFLKRFVKVNSKCLLYGHYRKGMTSIMFKAGLWMRAASQLLQEGCRSPWVKAVPELPGKPHLGPAACKHRASVPDGLLAAGSEPLQRVNRIQRRLGEPQTKLGSLLASGEPGQRCSEELFACHK